MAWLGGMALGAAILSVSSIGFVLLRDPAPQVDAETVAALEAIVVEYAVLDPGSRLLQGLDRVPPEAVSVRVHADREGRPAFRSITFARPHELVYRDGVQVRLREAPMGQTQAPAGDNTDE